MPQRSQIFSEDKALARPSDASPRKRGPSSAGALTQPAAAVAPLAQASRPPSFAAYSAMQTSLQQDALCLLALAACLLPGVLRALKRRELTLALWAAAQVSWQGQLSAQEVAERGSGARA